MNAYGRQQQTEDRIGDTPVRQQTRPGTQMKNVIYCNTMRLGRNTITKKISDTKSRVNRTPNTTDHLYKIRVDKNSDVSYIQIQSIHNNLYVRSVMPVDYVN